MSKPFTKFQAFVIWCDSRGRRKSEGFATMKLARGFKHYLGIALGLKGRVVNPD